MLIEDVLLLHETREIDICISRMTKDQKLDYVDKYCVCKDFGDYVLYNLTLVLAYGAFYEHNSQLACSLIEEAIEFRCGCNDIDLSIKMHMMIKKGLIVQI